MRPAGTSRTAEIAAGVVNVCIMLSSRALRFRCMKSYVAFEDRATLSLRRKCIYAGKGSVFVATAVDLTQ
ncbi:hypothetical protein, partial [Streptomyces sp. NPDC001380]|uniref:hypothetical protein n=1 Tax=Streptomyces sp. NPDC001380 TaxID=3364566 RepID=UPI003692F01A